MNFFDKLAVSLLVICGILVGQIEAAMPGAFSRAAVAERVKLETDVTRAASFQLEAVFFFMVEQFTYSTNGNLLTKGTSSTLYLGSYERELHQTKTNGTAPAVLVETLHRHSLGGGAIYTRTVGGPSPGVKLMNVLADHLGSTDVIVTGKWNTSTAAFANITTERQSFDAWGERRAADTQVNYRATDADAFRTSAQDYDRGYTGHEQMDDSGLIHMNGRIYDPELGRFLAPDPYVQIPEYSQNFNRYSYVLNNPLNATDPSGFSFIGKIFGKVGDFIKENWRTIVVIVVVVVVTFVTFGTATAPAASWGAAILGATATSAVTAAAGAWAVSAIGGAFLGGIIGGFNAALAGGDLGDVLRGAVIGGISGAITGALGNGVESSYNAGNYAQSGAYAVGHGIVEGAKNVAMGGKFQDGFLSAAAGSAAGLLPYGNNNGIGGLIKTSVVGGTANVLGGGKFANGASMAAFQYLLSEGLSKAEQKYGASHQQKDSSCLVASCKNAIDALGDTSPSEAHLRDLFDKINPHNWDSGPGAGSLFVEAETVMKGLGYTVTYNRRASLGGLLKLNGPTVLGISWNGGGGHAILLQKTTFKTFLFFFKYDRRYTVIDPWNDSPDARRGSPSARTLTTSQMRNYEGYGYISNGKFDGQALNVQKR